MPPHPSGMPSPATCLQLWGEICSSTTRVSVRPSSVLTETGTPFIASSRETWTLVTRSFPTGDRLRTMLNIEIIKTDLENELLYLKGSIPGSKNTEVVVRQSVKNINKMTISEKIAAAEEAKKTPDKKKK